MLVLRYVVSGQTTVGGVVVRNKGQEALSRLSLQHVKVLLKVVRKEHSIIILEVLVELGDDLAKAILLLSIFN